MKSKKVAKKLGLLKAQKLGKQPTTSELYGK